MFRANLLREMGQAGMTAEDVAERVGVRVATVERWIEGEGKPSQANRAKLFRLFVTSPQIAEPMTLFDPAPSEDMEPAAEDMEPAAEDMEPEVEGPGDYFSDRTSHRVRVPSNLVRAACMLLARAMDPGADVPDDAHLAYIEGGGAGGVVITWITRKEDPR